MNPTADLLDPLELAAMPIRQSDPTARLLLVDVRSARSYHRARLPGSQHIPAARLLSSELPDADLILIGDEHHSAAALIERLHSQGYPRRIRALRGGLEAWAARGLPLESSFRRAPAAFRLWRTASA